MVRLALRCAVRDQQEKPEESSDHNADEDERDAEDNPNDGLA
jgi:hypothetical protein